MTFCAIHNHDYTDEHIVAGLADFLYQIADSSECPESAVKSALAAITLFYEGLGKLSPFYDSGINGSKWH